MTNRVSFTNITKWYQETTNYLSDSTVRILVGNKCDMGTPFRVVTEEEGQELAQSLGVEYIETSAKNSVNVAILFDKMAASILSKIYVNPNLAIYPKSIQQGKKINKKRCCG